MTATRTYADKRAVCDGPSTARYRRQLPTATPRSDAVSWRSAQFSARTESALVCAKPLPRIRRPLRITRRVSLSVARTTTATGRTAEANALFTEEPLGRSFVEPGA